MILPAWKTKAFTFSMMVRPTFFQRGQRYTGNSMMKKLRSLARSTFLSTQAESTADTKPIRYKPIRATPCRLKTPSTDSSGTTRATSTV